MREMVFLIVAASIGSGHMKAAEAVADALKIKYPDARVHTVDFTGWCVSWATALMKSCYLFMLRFIPNLYEVMYRFAGGRKGGLSMQSLVSALTSRDIASLVRKYRPSAVICTHPFPAGATSWRKERHPDEFLFATVITDYSVHQMWVYPNADCYFVARESMKSDLIAAGLAEERIFVTGIPVTARFRRREGRQSILESLGLNADEKTILLMGGGLGLGGVEAALDELERVAIPIQLLVVAGKNEKLRERVEERAKTSHHTIRVWGYSQRVREFMAVSDFIITKPGALTISEALSAELPMLLHEPIPGPETENAVYVSREGAALWVNSGEKLGEAIRFCLSSDERLAAMRQRAHELKRPYAARDIVGALSVILDRFMDFKKITNGKVSGRDFESRGE
ncbi:MAG: UDP-glucuronosyltransferase [Schwartzia sp.]|nr:UDP-glucuronosyltransferase [Schwartzia sp. (in: firmicutes)]